jgi:Sec-independent protein secretion pathway component TatC
MYVLYEIGIFFSRMIVKRREAEQAEAEAAGTEQ